MPRNVIIDRDLGWRRIKRQTLALRGRGVKVGVLAGPGAQENDGVPIVEYAVYNEFGTSQGVPARPFMRRTADQAEKAVTGFGRRLLNRVLTGQASSEQLLDSLGLWFQSRIRATIRGSRSWAKPNTPSTIRSKGSSTPLVDDGMLIGAISYEKTGR